MIIKKKEQIAFEFDGVIHNDIYEWEAPHIIKGDPVSGIKEVIDNLKEDNYIVVYSMRARYKSGLKAIQNFMDENKIYYDIITDVMVDAKVNVVASAIRFTGKTDKLEYDIRNFKPWNYGDKET
jgi:hypothetical protein